MHFFFQGEATKSFTVSTTVDDVLEGEEQFVVSLLNAANGAVVSPLNGEAVIIILPNTGASGIVSIEHGMYITII